MPAKIFRRLNDLKDKKVNFGKKGSGTFLTSSTIFNKLGIEVSVTNFDQATALEKLKTGELGAMVFVVGKPASSLKTHNRHRKPTNPSYTLSLLIARYVPTFSLES